MRHFDNENPEKVGKLRRLNANLSALESKIERFPNRPKRTSWVFHVRRLRKQIDAIWTELENSAEGR